ncbi:hypothetical protein DBR32_02265 [Taibaiella sp. KBW10]|uniref:hypothetical protein n=1 Tax=Taibaiella sp. KBW10 TaxID=2153357 RepID=UPI000F5A11D4|nr:hypothetical protein [Taibaiella sp. KBW10]RQO32450.1 hypothetical protein DBR32_02265 [Taibaiella sp. KBW10]
MNRRVWGTWTVRRLAYLIIGLWIAIQSAMGQEWLLAALGGYFSVLAIFKLGCAGNQCTTLNTIKK